MTCFGVDISNYTGWLGSAEIGAMQGHGVQHVVLRASLEPGRQRVEIARQQMDALTAAGIDWSVYLWCYGAWSPEQTVIDTVGLLAGRPCRWFWLDVEDEGDPVSADWINRAIAECQRQGRLPGIYTGAWYWEPRYGEWSPSVPLWTADYDGDPSLVTAALYSGWDAAELYGKQYAGSGQQTTFPFSCDLNTFVDAVLTPVPPPPTPEPEPEPPPDGEPVVTIEGVKIGLIDKIIHDQWEAAYHDLGQIVGVP